MITPNIDTSKPIVPMIYAYTTPEVLRHNGWTKIGYTEQNVETRIKQQTHTADIAWNLEWKGNAIFDDGSAETFTDKDFHAYLRKSGVEQEDGKNNEWFHITGPSSRIMFYDFRADHGVLKSMQTVIPYQLRDEQNEAVQMTIDYYNTHKNGEFLWNAKPRFGKTLSVYDFCKKIGANSVLIVTNRPAIANSWFSDYQKFIGADNGYYFVSEVDALKGKSGVLSKEEFSKLALSSDNECKCIEFVSLQDMKGSVHFGGEFDKLSEVRNTEWDVLVVDEAHEGVDTYKTDVAFDRIHRKFTLHLSGTPFKALANSKFADDAIFNWTYADEQTKKRNWDVSSEKENPYETLPQLNLYTYQMSEIVKEELQQGMDLDGETVEYAFDLNEFFATTNGKFTHDSSVDKFLDALTLQKKFPFSTPELRAELNHTFWLLDRVDSAKALAKKLKEHPIFMEYEIIVAAGDGRLDDEEATMKSYDKVVKAISEHAKTITLSVGQLTTGITIPEWTAVLMLSNVKSPSLYMQAAFRSQNPCLFKTANGYERKENAYVFDFDPARTLTIYERFANDLSSRTSSGRGNTEEHKANIRELLNFFPVIGEDENGELTELDAEKVLIIPRKIRSVEVVRRCFMSNFLFQNINNVFSAPKEVLKIINNFEAVSEVNSVPVSEERAREITVDEEGQAVVDDEIIIGKSVELFGAKIFDITDKVKEVSISIEEKKEPEERIADHLKEYIKQTAVHTIVETVSTAYGSDVRASDKRQIESKLNSTTERIVDTSLLKFNIEKKEIEAERTTALQSRFDSGKTTEEINKEFDKKQQEAITKFQEEISTAFQTFIETSKEETVRTVETKIMEREKDSIEDGIRDHLRGFSRTIPSFLMAYGTEEVTLATFDTIIPDKVFKEVTSITLDEFRFLRDGGSYTDSETGEEKHFVGQLFDPVVFNDSVKEFLALKKKLANYFDENNEEDIFDYIPPQKTNQIFTPKKVVKHMVDLLEQENPGCFNMPDKTFADLYMKSGLYITEIVKRLYNSDALKQLHPDSNERLRHIFEKQVYGLAPTEIIYRIALEYILGFDKEVKISNHNFRQVDALHYVKENTLFDKLEEIFK